MEIHGGNGRARELANLLFGIQETNAKPKVSKSGSEGESASHGPDTVAISQEARVLLEELGQFRLGTHPDIAARRARTEELQDLIRRDAYHPDPKDVSDAILRSVLGDFASS